MVNNSGLEDHWVFHYIVIENCERIECSEIESECALLSTC